MWIAVCLAFGAILGAAAFAAFGEQPAKWIAAPVRAEWLGFVGAILSGATTLAAAALAWFSVERQLFHSRRAVTRKERESASLVRYVVMSAGNSAKNYIKMCDEALSDDESENMMGWLLILMFNTMPRLGASLEDAERAIEYLPYDVIVSTRGALEAERSIRKVLEGLPKPAFGPDVPDIDPNAVNLIREKATAVVALAQGAAPGLTEVMEGTHPSAKR
jgi:hypothetical protein